MRSMLLFQYILNKHHLLQLVLILTTTKTSNKYLNWNDIKAKQNFYKKLIKMKKLNNTWPKLKYQIIEF